VAPLSSASLHTVASVANKNRKFIQHIEMHEQFDKNNQHISV